MPVLDPLTPDRLAAVADLADARLLAVPDDGPCLVRVRCLGPEVELGWLPLRGVHPLDLLAGQAVPDDWAALGVAAAGRAHVVGDGRSAPVPVRSVHVVGRDGSWAARCVPIGPASPRRLPVPTAACGPPGADDQPLGRVDDACRRALGLPTPPPAAGTAALWGRQWVDAIVQRAATGRVDGWESVAALHPAVAALRPGGPGGVDLVQLVALAGQLAAWRDWPVLRRSCAAGTWPCGEVDPDLAAWLDDGAFSRWLLGAYPDLDDLRDAVRALVTGDLADAVDAVLEATGATEGAWP